MIASADHDPIRSHDVKLLLMKADQLPSSQRVIALRIAVRNGDGDAMERLAELVEARR